MRCAKRRWARQSADDSRGGHPSVDSDGIQVKQFPYGADNLAYLLYTRRAALAVDGGAVQAMTAFVRAHGLNLTAVTNTHGHGDHTSGNRDLMDRTGAPYVPAAEMVEAGGWRLEGGIVAVFATPGHSADAVVLQAGRFLITGDTLFNGTVGNCFTGDLAAFYSSIRRITAFPDDSVIYAGHDYVSEAMAFARRLEPENPHIDDFLRRYRPEHVYSTLADEKRVNPYLRFNQEPIAALLRRKGLPVDTPFNRFKAVMALG